MVMPGASVGQDTPAMPASPDPQQVAGQPTFSGPSWEDLQQLQSALDQRIAQTEQYYGQRLTSAEQMAFDARQRAWDAEQQLEELFANQSPQGNPLSYDAEGNPINQSQSPTDRNLQRRLTRAEQKAQQSDQARVYEADKAFFTGQVQDTLRTAEKFGVNWNHPAVDRAQDEPHPARWAARVNASILRAIDTNVQRLTAQQQRFAASQAPAVGQNFPSTQGHPMAPRQETAGPSAGSQGGILANWENLSRKDREAAIAGMKRGKLTQADL